VSRTLVRKNQEGRAGFEYLAGEVSRNIGDGCIRVPDSDDWIQRTGVKPARARRREMREAVERVTNSAVCVDAGGFLLPSNNGPRFDEAGDSAWSMNGRDIEWLRCRPSRLIAEYQSEAPVWSSLC